MQTLPSDPWRWDAVDMARAIRKVLFRSRLHDPFRPFVRWLRRNPAIRPLTYRLERLVQEPGVTRHIGT